MTTKKPKWTTGWLCVDEDGWVTFYYVSLELTPLDDDYIGREWQAELSDKLWHSAMAFLAQYECRDFAVPEPAGDPIQVELELCD